ncbi:NAD(P)/FAD-dependent oxidoreductase [Pseudoflavitalea sp. X16]|uniref:NAD(P)/FAD-dependent oxidoreductase n=1 Tax=Paraflavitalea devenefica TaxID=2716334 RepID=UPI001423E0BD|nr:NAD(P)/FAD-dependent oxidoreductase [Paraflavitalea devenefica]NII28292.1 NAD(P)/FAD-dependent oxidoreductase [Paraflavitalea devenefica]
MLHKKKRLVVIGGGAAGFFCAINAARLDPALEVIILEKSNKILSKVKVSGGGRCNVTHACFSIAEMVCKYPRGANFLKKTFHHFFTTDTIAWFKERGIALKTEADGRMFPVTDSSQTIIDCLMREVNRYGIEVRMKSEVRSLKYEAGSQVSESGVGSQELATGRFIIELSDLRPLTSDFVCIACGGYPKAAMFDWLKQLGHSIEVPVPSLFTFNMPGNPITRLMGVSVPDAQVRITGSKLSSSGPLLITHWGMSGPAILRLSAWGARELAAGNYQFTIQVNWLAAYNENSLREYLQELRFELATQKISNRNPFGLPQRLWDYLLEQSGINGDIRWADLPAAAQNKLIKNCCVQEFAVRGKTTFKEEFVTAGGIRLTEIDANTMQSKLLPRLFFAGEILDVDGITGGFNFQHAWTSGFIAATAIVKCQTEPAEAS